MERLACLCTLWAVESAPTRADPMNERCPQCPVLTALPGSQRLSLGLLLCSLSVHLTLGLRLFLLLPAIFTALLSFPENLAFS